MAKYQSPSWRNVAAPGPSGNAKYDTKKAQQQISENRRQAEIAHAHDKAPSGLHDLSDKELHHLGYIRHRGFFGQVIGITPTKVAHDRHIAINEERAARKQDMKDRAKRKAKSTVKKAWNGGGAPKKRGFFYWE
jgi:hypothetical protein